MPEVLAAYTNGELEEGDRQLRSHLERCVTCQATVARMERAERVFAGTGAARQARPEPAPEPEAEPEPLAAEPEAAPVAAEPQPAAEASPAAEPTASPPPTPIPRPAPEVVRVRRGGLLGAARKMTGGTPPSRRSQS